MVSPKLTFLNGSYEYNAGEWILPEGATIEMKDGGPKVIAQITGGNYDFDHMYQSALKSARYALRADSN
jgi:hypothetical protein